MTFRGVSQTFHTPRGIGELDGTGLDKATPSGVKAMIGDAGATVLYAGSQGLTLGSIRPT
jgi:hypothetical protein